MSKSTIYDGLYECFKNRHNNVSITDAAMFPNMCAFHAFEVWRARTKAPIMLVSTRQVTGGIWCVWEEV